MNLGRGATALAIVAAAHALAIAWALQRAPSVAIKVIEPPRLSASLIAPTPRPTPAAQPAKPQRQASTPPKPASAPRPKPPPQDAPARLPAQPLPAAEPSESRPATAAPGESSPRPQAAASPQPAAVSDAVVPPHADASHLGNPAPRYPALSRKLGEEGEVQLKLLVKADGSVGEVQVRRSSGYARLDQAALRAAARWRFVPARQGSTPIDYWYLQSVRFALDAA